MQMQKVVTHTAECGNWKELERVCRCKGDVRYTAEFENWEELKSMHMQSGCQAHC
jgi:hypothetical protein